VNIVSGFLVAAPKLKTAVKHEGVIENINTAESTLTRWSKSIGIIELVLGVLALLQRMGLVYLYIPRFGASYPQVIIAILIGLILASSLFEKNIWIKTKIELISPYTAIIGIAGILIGLFSIF